VNNHTATYHPIEHKEIIVKSKLSELLTIRSFVEAQATQFGFSEKEVFQVCLAVDEACSNIIRHGYKLDDNNTIKIEVYSAGERFVISILDMSLPFDQRSIPSPDMDEYFSKYKHGGLGIHLIRTIMNEIEYIPSTKPGSYNELRLSKMI
jgi:serine/threonine-protein kinase RsbW